MANVIKGNKSGLAASFGGPLGSLGSVAGGVRPSLPNSTVTSTRRGTGSVIGHMQGINLGAPITRLGATFGRHMQTGVEKNSIEGDPTTPCLELVYPGMWRFRWAVSAGSHGMSVRAKQACNLTPYPSTEFPSMVVKANSDVGLSSDIVAYSGGGLGWTTIGPSTFTFTATGVVWVELWNNCVNFPFSAFFDHIVST